MEVVILNIWPASCKTKKFYNILKLLNVQNFKNHLKIEIYILSLHWMKKNISY